MKSSIPADSIPVGHAGIDARLKLGPRIHPTAYVVPSAIVIGDVTLMEESSVWYGAVLRGDLNRITIGARSIIGANALVTLGTKIPPGSLVLGSPAKVKRALTLDEQKDIARWAWSYVETSKHFREFYSR
jgi:carbonic anhydrase/acetyltransferase-like protein (isoleucine patch superfamily)